MNSSARDRTALIEKVSVSGKALCVDFDDGRSLFVPLTWYPRLKDASPKERRTYRLIGGGNGIHWPLLDEDLSAAGLLSGRPSGEGAISFRRWLRGRRESRGASK